MDKMKEPMTAKELKNLRVFGYGLGIIITFFVVRHGMKHGFWVVSYIWLAVAAALGVITAVNVPSLKPFYTRWMKVAHFIGTIVSGVILSLLFYVVFGIPGIIMRVLRIDLLHQKIDKKIPSYWIARERKPFDKKSYQYQF